MPKYFRLSLLLLLLAGAAFTAFHFLHHSDEAEREAMEAADAFQFWGLARTFPDGRFHTEKYAEAIAQMQMAAYFRDERDPVWEALGPKNVGGRTLCLAINPLDTNVLWMGSASGGIWKSTTAGRGANAWQRIETGFPVLGVSAIALDPSNPDIIYAGTGEVYNVENSSPNVAIRVTRGTYGIGILKSSNGGATWTKSLDWSYGDLRGVQDIKINPLRPQSILAATSEGLLRSWDAGASWHTIHPKRMAVDIEISPADTNIIFVTHGSLDDTDVSGIYRSTNGGASFTELGGGLPANYTGKALLSICEGQPSVMYASVGNAFAQDGLYKSTNGGNTWVRTSSEDVCKYQGWYSHDVAVHPTNPGKIVWVGIDGFISSNSGSSIQQTSYWYKWFLGFVPAGASEGPSDYVHADIHRIYYTPGAPDKVYVVSDGGLFVSYNGGQSWQGRNGGYQTQQFYANLGNSSSNPNWAIGGMQDNATVIYSGQGSWQRVLGGDGECAAIHPQHDNILFGSSQYLNMSKTTNGGADWYGIGGEINEAAAFNGPFEIAPSSPAIMYAGAQSIWRSEDEGESWFQITEPLAGNDLVLSIAVSPENPDLLYCSTAPVEGSDKARVFKINAANFEATELNGLPNRLCMDIAFDPANDSVLVAVFAGFNAEHVWRSTDGGANWQSISNGLPDVPTNAVIIDPVTGHYYIGNDLGVWHSANAGQSWDFYSAQAPQAMLSMHLSIVPGRKLRVATYGLGVWQTDLVETSGAGEVLAAPLLDNVFPNPAREQCTASFTLPGARNARISLIDAGGKTVWQGTREKLPAGSHRKSIPLQGLPGGMYAVVLEVDGKRSGKTITVQ